MEVYGRTCMAGNCFRKYDGVEDSLFRSSTVIACGYEIGWEFMESVMSSRQTFSGYRKVIQSRYERVSSPFPFMSLNSFIKWWFSWASAMDIDFRQGCYSCGKDINILAADGTKLGITMKQSSVIPMETVEDPTVIQTSNRRYDRTLVNNAMDKTNRKNISKYIHNLCEHILGKNKTVTQNEINNWETNLASLPLQIRMIIWTMLSNVQEMEKKAIASFLVVVNKDSSITNLIPISKLQETKAVLQALEGDNYANRISTFIQSTRFFFPELGDLMYTSSKLSGDGKPRESVQSFIHYLVKRIEDIHTDNTEPAEISMVRKYNPARDGRAYYFNDDGSQLRRVRSHSIDTSKEKTNFDDKPSVACNKSYPIVSKKGMTYLFLWFCPAHGHCYGFHVITGSEGRKDAATSLYAYLKKAPQVIFYDFACSLDEYCKNRENGFFKNTKMYHDIFHGYGHSCSEIFKSNRLLGFEGINTSICEQFNSFIQCVKASSKLMTQEHFAFYVQIFIHQWNLQRKNSFLKKLTVAIAGYQ